MRFNWLVVMLVSAVIIAPAFGDDEVSKKKRKGQKNRQRSLATNVIKRLDAVNLTEDQVTKIKELARDADEKVQEVRSEAGITDDMIKARSAAQKSLKNSGKKGKELIVAVNQKAGYNEAQSQAFKVENRLRTKFVLAAIALLSDEQKEELPKQMQRTLVRSQKRKDRQR